MNRFHSLLNHFAQELIRFNAQSTPSRIQSTYLTHLTIDSGAIYLPIYAISYMGSFSGAIYVNPHLPWLCHLTSNSNWNKLRSGFVLTQHWWHYPTRSAHHFTKFMLPDTWLYITSTTITLSRTSNSLLLLSDIACQLALPHTSSHLWIPNVTPYHLFPDSGTVHITSHLLRLPPPHPSLTVLTSPTLTLHSFTLPQLTSNLAIFHLVSESVLTHRWLWLLLWPSP